MDSGKGGIWLIMPGVHLILQIPEPVSTQKMGNTDSIKNSENQLHKQ